MNKLELNYKVNTLRVNDLKMALFMIECSYTACGRTNRSVVANIINCSYYNKNGKQLNRLKVYE